MSLEFNQDIYGFWGGMLVSAMETVEEGLEGFRNCVARAIDEPERDFRAEELQLFCQESAEEDLDMDGIYYIEADVESKDKYEAEEENDDEEESMWSGITRG